MTIASRDVPRRAGAILALCVLVAACGTRELSGSRDRNVDSPAVSSQSMSKTMTCTNFDSALNSDMSAPGAKVTLTFCPDATRYVLTWATNEPTSVQLLPGAMSVTLVGSDFLTRGPLTIDVFRDFPNELNFNRNPASLRLSSFTLSVMPVNGRSLLTGVWDVDSEAADVNLLGWAVSSAGPKFAASYLSYLAARYVWFYRARCQARDGLSDSERFLLDFRSTNETTTLVQLIGNAMMSAKNWPAALAERRSVFRSLALVQAKLGDFVANRLCDPTAVPVDPPSPDRLEFLHEKAAALRAAVRALETEYCAKNGDGSLDPMRSLFGIFFESSGDPGEWRLSNEPDKSALETAYYRLIFPTFVTEVGSSPTERALICSWQSSNDPVWSAVDVSQFFDPTTTTSTTSSSSTSTTVESATMNSINGTRSEKTPITVTGSDSTSSSLLPTEVTTIAPIDPVASPSSTIPIGTRTSAPSATVVDVADVSTTTVRPVVWRQQPTWLLSVGYRLSFSTLAGLANIPVAKGQTISILVSTASARQCRVQALTVRGVREGVCQMRITASERGKAVKRGSLRLVVGPTP